MARYRFNGAAAKSSGKSAGPRTPATRVEAASMGPPLKAAENQHQGGQHEHQQGYASMGPPLKAAENIASAAVPTTPTAGFNGAAAKSSGK